MMRQRLTLAAACVLVACGGSDNKITLGNSEARGSVDRLTTRASDPDGRVWLLI